MANADLLEIALSRAFATITGPATPPQLRAAMRHAVFPGGARLRPRLVLEVTRACARTEVAVARELAIALELVHCASLVHDDLPCFDNAPVRRGRPSVQARFGESLAVLVGDALIVGAFDVLGRVIAGCPRLIPAVGVLASAVGARGGLVAGQAWETEPLADLGRYHRAKTGALFEAAVEMGALAGGGRPDEWLALGETLGAAYQLADDILDLTASASARGKPVGQDLLLGRPSAVFELGIEGASAAFHRAIARLPELVPEAPGAQEFRAWLAEAVAGIFAPVYTTATPALTEASMSA
jgi:geranylgeranyl diphosphate synthase type II